MEMWYGLRQWLKAGGAIDPKDDQLYEDLIGPETISRPDGIYQLESKKDMKDRGQPSPNRGDALALTFAMPVEAKDDRVKEVAYQDETMNNDYNPIERMSKSSKSKNDYNPLKGF